MEALRSRAAIRMRGLCKAPTANRKSIMWTHTGTCRRRPIDWHRSRTKQNSIETLLPQSFKLKPGVRIGNIICVIILAVAGGGGRGGATDGNGGGQWSIMGYSKQRCLPQKKCTYKTETERRCVHLTFVLPINSLRFSLLPQGSNVSMATNTLS